MVSLVWSQTMSVVAKSVLCKSISANSLCGSFCTVFLYKTYTEDKPCMKSYCGPSCELRVLLLCHTHLTSIPETCVHGFFLALMLLGRSWQCIVIDPQVL